MSQSPVCIFVSAWQQPVVVIAAADLRRLYDDLPAMTQATPRGCDRRRFPNFRPSNAATGAVAQLLVLVHLGIEWSSGLA